MKSQNKNSFLEKFLKMGNVKWENGIIKVAEVPMMLTRVGLEAYKFALMERNIGYKKAMSMQFAFGKFNGDRAFDLFAKKYGMEKRFNNARELLENISAQSQIVGMGNWEWVMVNTKKELFILNADFIYPKIFKERIGIQKRAVDHHMRGVLSTFISKILNKQCLAVETKCISKGQRRCEIIIKPLEKWKKDKKNMKLFLEQKPSRIKDDIPFKKVF